MGRLYDVPLGVCTSVVGKRQGLQIIRFFSFVGVVEGTGLAAQASPPSKSERRSLLRYPLDLALKNGGSGL